MEQFKIKGYTITGDSDFIDQQFNLTPALKNKLAWLHTLALRGHKSSVPKFLKAIEQYPDSPHVKNHLSVLYNQMGEEQKAFETNHWIVAEHPDYLFGKLNLANEHYIKGEYEKMPEVLGEAMELKSLYPEREVFHIQEVMAFLGTTILYFTAMNDLEQAEMRLKLMKEVDPDSSDIALAEEAVMQARFVSIKKRMEEEEAARISVDMPQREYSRKTAPPRFLNEEINILYQQGLTIDPGQIQKILSLPRESLIRDLELVLQDSIDRYIYFKEKIEDEGYIEEELSFILHAWFLLGEIGAEESLDELIKTLDQSKDFLEFYFGDHLSESLWEVLYKLAKDRLDVLGKLVQLPGGYTYSRGIPLAVVEQICYHHPARKEEIINWLGEQLRFFNSSKLEDNVIDSQLIAFAVSSALNIKAEELLPEIEDLYMKGWVSTGVCGDLEDVRKDFEEPKTFMRKLEIMPIAERYREITSTWASYTEEDENDWEPPFFPPLPEKREKKVGRNDPCPCGSGKKYKKCCLSKELGL